MNSQVESDRMNRILNELSQDLNTMMLNSEQNESTLNDKLKQLQERMISVMRTNCSEAFNWFEKNKFNLKETQATPEAAKYMRELQECASRFDYGLRGEMMNAEREMNSLNNNHNSCTQNCMADQSNDDASIKVCLKRCFSATFERTSSLQQNLSKKVDEVIFNLNKI
jgi:hypothetical protein